MRLVILDRDGVINEDSDDYIKSPAEWQPIPGSLEAMARLHHAGYRIVVATNQSGIARGLYDLDTLMRIHEKMHRAAADVGAVIDAVFYCPHGPKDNCSCRKPKPGLLHEIAKRFRIDLKGVPAIGDSLRDIIAARAVSAAPILLRTGKGARIDVDTPELEGVPIFADLAAAVDNLLELPEVRIDNA